MEGGAHWGVSVEQKTNVVSRQATYIPKGAEKKQGMLRGGLFQTEISASVKALRQKLQMFKELQGQCDWK